MLEAARGFGSPRGVLMIGHMFSAIHRKLTGFSRVAVWIGGLDELDDGVVKIR